MNRRVVCAWNISHGNEATVHSWCSCVNCSRMISTHDLQVMVEWNEPILQGKNLKINIQFFFCSIIEVM